MRVKMVSSKAVFESIGPSYRVIGIALRPGTWTGIDGHTVTYPRSIFSKDHIRFCERYIKDSHGIDARIIGFITGYRFDDEGLWIKGYLFEKPRNEGLSIEADVKLASGGVATDVVIDAVALVKVPAVEGAGLKEIEKVKLSGLEFEVLREDDLVPGYQFSEVEPVSESNTSTNEVNVENRKKLHPITKWLKEILRKEKIEKDLIERIAEVVEKALEEGKYPYPQPVANVANEDVKALLETVEKLEARINEMETRQKQEKIHLMLERIRRVKPDFRPEKEIEGYEKMNLDDKIRVLEGVATGLEKAPKTVAIQETNKDRLDELIESTLRKMGVEVE